MNTSGWAFGHDVLIASQWIDDIRWLDATVSGDIRWLNATVSGDINCQAVKDVPVYDPAVTFDRQQEQPLRQHYGCSGYWAAA